MTQPVRVFISYSHDSPLHRQQVLDFATQLRSHGVDAWLDRYDPHPPEGWPRWMQRQVEQADFIVLVCTATFRRRFEGREAPGTGRGIAWEGMLCQLLLYEDSAENRRLVPVLLSPEEREDEVVPTVLRSFTNYRLPDAYGSLLRRLTRQPEIVPTQLGSQPHAITDDQVAAPAIAPASELRAPDVLSDGMPETPIEPATPPQPQVAAPVFVAEASSHGADQELLASQQEELVLREQGQDLSGVWRRMAELKRKQRAPELPVGKGTLVGGRFELRDMIGHGGFGSVWKAWDRRTRAFVALKMLHHHLCTSHDRAQRFARGAKTMARLQHPGIVRVIEVGLHFAGAPCFAMDYIAGGSLAQAHKAGTLNREQALPLLIELCQAVAYAHSEGVIHRDIKPDNVLLTADGHVKLTDFDLVQAQDTTGRTLGGMGSQWFCPREQMRDAATVDARADVFALGMCGVFLLGGMAEVEKAYVDPARLNRTLRNKPLGALLAQACATDPLQRPASVTLLLQGIQDIQSGRALNNQPPRVTQPTPTARPRTKRPPKYFPLTRMGHGDELVTFTVLGMGIMGAIIWAGLKATTDWAHKARPVIPYRQASSGTAHPCGPETTSEPPRPTSGPQFGNPQITDYLQYTARMANPITEIEGSLTADGFTVKIPSNVTFDRARPFANAHPLIADALTVNRKESMLLRVHFTAGESPEAFVYADRDKLHILVGCTSP